MTTAGKRQVLYVDAAAGAAGDMLLGAFVDLGVPLAHLQEAWDALPLEGFTIKAHRVLRCGLAAQKIDVELVDTTAPGRGMEDILRILDGSRLDASVRRRAAGVFQRLIDAEAEAHGQPSDRVHLHEAGAVDAIVDVVGACVALEYLGVPWVHVSAMTVGFGSVRCAHGVLPVPAPATLALIRGCPVVGGDIEAERLTPTGAAILTAFADAWGPMPPCRPRSFGIGAGSRDLDGTPNCVRLILADPVEDAVTGVDGAAEPAGAWPTDEVAVIECTLDDCTPQLLAYAAERLLESGALDTFTTPVTMKKGRPGHNLTVLAAPHRVTALAEVLLGETSTLGLRVHHERRVVLERSWTTAQTAWGPVRVKIGSHEGHVWNAWPEYEDCAALARRSRVPLRDVQQAALRDYDLSRTTKEIE